MKIKKKICNDVINNKKCFLYFFEKEPKCFLTNLLTYSKDINIFDNDDEEKKFTYHECHGDLSNCLYIDALWQYNEDKVDDLEEDEDKVDDLEEDKVEDLEEIPLLEFNNITVDFDYSLPFDKDIRTDALLIPTDTNLHFYNFIDFGEDNDFLINECKKRQLPFLEGDVVKTFGARTGFPILFHCVIVKNSDLVPEIMNIGLSLYTALSKADDEKCKSVSIYPLVDFSGDISMPSMNLYIKACLTTIKTFSEENQIQNLEYILIHIPSNFILDLQEIASKI